MKLALVTPGGVDESGTEWVIPAFLWLIERLARRHDVHVFAIAQEPHPREWSLLGARVHNVGSAGARRLRFQRAFAREHRRAPFALVHALFGGSAMHAIPAGMRFGIPVVTHLAGGELVSLADIGYGDLCTVRGRLQTRAVAALSSDISVGTVYMQRLASSLGISARIIPLGVALDRWPRREPRARPPGQPARLLNVSDVRPVKDHRTLLEAAALLRTRGLSFELHLAGWDTTGGAMQRSDTARAVADVTQWHGLLRREALHALMCESDLLLHTSRHEAGPLVVLEAAVVGVPTVGANVGHVAELAPDAAVAVSASDPAALADAVAALLDDEPRRVRLAREAQRRAVEIEADFTMASFERQYADVLARARR
jgi:glycosyltransferase involved in cell wall biosynthesis